MKCRREIPPNRTHTIANQYTIPPPNPPTEKRICKCDPTRWIWITYVLHSAHPHKVHEIITQIRLQKYAKALSFVAKTIVRQPNRIHRRTAHAAADKEHTHTTYKNVPHRHPHTSGSGSGLKNDVYVHETAFGFHLTREQYWLTYDICICICNGNVDESRKYREREPQTHTFCTRTQHYSMQPLLTISGSSGCNATKKTCWADSCPMHGWMMRIAGAGTFSP